MNVQRHRSADLANMNSSDLTADIGTREVAERLGRRPWPVTPLCRTSRVSFEFFPPAGDTGSTSLSESVAKLEPLDPRFVSVTYGAGGTTQDRTSRTIEDLVKTTELDVAGHLTCVGATKRETDEVLDGYLATGVRHIVALRGDPPADDGSGDVPMIEQPGYRDAADLVAGVRRRADEQRVAVEISVGAYPEVHPRAASAQADLDSLKAKLDAGADQAITQFCFDTDVYLRFLDRARAAGITDPIVPGIMPVTNFANIQRFAARCGTSIPDWMVDLFDGLDDMPEVRPLVAATVAAEQCRRLAEHGVNDFHFYTMNRADLSLAVCRMLGVVPANAATKRSIA